MYAGVNIEELSPISIFPRTMEKQAIDCQATAIKMLLW
jgi:hypothetical protein